MHQLEFQKTFIYFEIQVHLWTFKTLACKLKTCFQSSQQLKKLDALAGHQGPCEPIIKTPFWFALMLSVSSMFVNYHKYTVLQRRLSMCN